jgi:starch synthase
LKILLAASEALPYVKTGGLADVAAALPKALEKLGEDIAVMIPLHRVVKEKHEKDLVPVASTSVKLGWREKYLGILKAQVGAVPYYFIDCEDYFGDAVYRGGDAESEQYLYFCRAVLAALPHIGWIPDVIHCNDWHTGMIPMLLKTQYEGTGLAGVKSVFTIHNIQFQGKMDFGLMHDYLGIPSRYYTPSGVEADGCANMMKAAILWSDRVTTVSPTYAREIQDAWQGFGLDGALHARGADLSGIVNGIDEEEFDPAGDPALVRGYSVSTMRLKWESKKALRSTLGLGGRLYDPILCMVTRLTEQKGIDLVRFVLEELLAEKLCFVLLGSGDREYESFFRYIAGKYPGKAGIRLGYDEALARQIYAGADFLLMPSQFEPCGLSQMIAQCYGTLPIVRETGGLADTVQPWNEYTKEGDGFSFRDYNAHDMLHTIRYALQVYRDKAALRILKKNAMLKDNRFLTSAEKYRQLYRSLS